MREEDSGEEVIRSFFFQAEDGIRDLVRSRGLGDVYKRQSLGDAYKFIKKKGSDSLKNTPFLNNYFVF